VAASNSPLHSENADHSATRRILDATARRVASDGAAALALSEIARDAGVSKALIHYHFTDKETLLARLIDHLARGMLAREREALRPFEHEHNPLAVDALWGWLEGELERGSINVLLELDAYRGPAVQASARAAAAARQAAAQETIERLFRILELRPRIEPSLLAAVHVAFVDGLAIRWGLATGEDRASTPPRVAFDVFWLAMLSLAE
jgi:AcrR family transcriptional regulator